MVGGGLRKLSTHMEAANKMYTYQTIEDVLEMLDRLNGMIALQQAQHRQDLLAIEGYKRQREQFTQQFVALLAPFGIELAHQRLESFDFIYH